MRARSLHQCSGMTLVEIVAAMAIATLIMANVVMVSRTGADATKSGVLKASIDDELDLTVERITLALMASSEDEITGPVMAPASSDFIHYTKTLGEEDGVAIISDPESISWEAVETRESSGNVVWTVDSEANGDRDVTWSRSVPVDFHDEVGGNGTDDNNNGLLDEGGLAFTQLEEKVEIHLTVQRVDEEGHLVQTDSKRTVTCRN